MTTRYHNTLPALVLVLLGGFIFAVGIGVNYTNMDEAYFSDPVINLLQGKGYTTTAWNITGQAETHVSTAPAYSLLLWLWLKVFGIAQTSVRTLSATLAIGSAFVFWRACLRSGMIKSGRAGAIVIGVLILDYGYAYSYSVGRPDSLSALLVATMFYCSTIQDRRVALAAIGAIALAMPFIQWGCIIYLFFLSAALFFISRENSFRFVIVVGGCMAAGLLAQKAIYVHEGVWDTWLNTIKSERSENIAKVIGQRMTVNVFINRHSNTMPKDFSALVILAGMAWLYFRSKRLHWREGVQFAQAAWMITLIVTLGMYFVGKFPTYYGWMLSFPLALILGLFFDQAPPEGRLEAKIAALIAGLACVVGLPLQAALATYDWNDRHAAAVTAWLGPKISKDDVVYCDYPYYYMVKPRAKQVFTGRYFSKMTPAEFNRLTLAIVGSHGSDWNLADRALTNAFAIATWKPARSGLLGNDWKYGILSAPNYSCTVYKFTTNNLVKP